MHIPTFQVQLTRWRSIWFSGEAPKDGARGREEDWRQPASVCLYFLPIPDYIFSSINEWSRTSFLTAENMKYPVKMLMNLSRSPSDLIQWKWEKERERFSRDLLFLWCWFWLLPKQILFYYCRLEIPIEIYLNYNPMTTILKWRLSVSRSSLYRMLLFNLVYLTVRVELCNHILTHFYRVDLLDILYTYVFVMIIQFFINSLKSEKNIM